MRTKVTDLHPNVEWDDPYLGIIHLVDGTVIVKRSWNETKECYQTNLYINHKGRLHISDPFEWPTQRFCTTLAKRFMKEVVQLSEGNNE